MKRSQTTQWRGVVRSLGGSIVILAMAALDFLVVRQMMEDSNTTVALGVIVALVLCAGLEGGPTIINYGLMLRKDKFAPKQGYEKFFVPNLMFGLGCIMTPIAIFIYVYLRVQLIITNGGFGMTEIAGIMQHYEGYAGDIITLVSPLITSAIAFGASVVVFSSGVEKKGKSAAQLKKAWDKAVARRTGYERAMQNVHQRIQGEWSYRMRDETMPDDPEEACKKINRSIGKELEPILKAQLSLALTQNTVLDPFVSMLKNKLRPYMGEDKDLLEALDISDYEDATTKTKLSKLLKEIENKPNDILRIIGSNAIENAIE